MADNKRDIELRIAATTSGSEAIVKLSDVLDSLAKEAGDAAPNFTALADAVRRIGEQGDAVAVLDRLEQQVKQTSDSFGTARERADALGQQLVEQRATTERYAATQQKAREAVDATRQALIANQTALSNLNAQYDRAGKATIGYKGQAEPLRETLRQLGLQLKQQRLDLEQSNRAYSEQSAALRKIDSDYTKAAAAAGELDASLKQQNASLEQAQNGLKQFGIAATTAATAIEKVEQAQQQATLKAFEAIAANQKQEEFLKRIAAANNRAAEQAKSAATERAAAAKRQAAADAEAASATEAAALRSRLAQQQLESQLKETELAQKSLNDAFAATGVRSAQAIESEIRQIVASLAALRSNASISGAEFDRAFKSAETRVEALKRELAGLPPLVKQTSDTAAILRQSFSQLTAAFGAFELGRGFIVANNQLETLRRSLTLVTGSTQVAQQQIALLRSVADDAGVSVGAISDSFIRFQASLNGAGVPLATTEAVFRSVINAAGQLGQSSERTSLVLDALAQIAAKGVVSMEELRQQLGDSLPGALSIAAKGLGVTTDELVKLVESGSVLAEDFLPSFAVALQESFGKGEQRVDSFIATWNRLKNTLAETAQFFGTEGGILSGIATVVDQASIAVRGLSGAFEFLGKSVGITAGFLANFDLSSPVQSVREYRRQITEAYDEIEQRLQRSNGNLDENNKRLDANAQSARGAADAQGSLAQSTGDAGTASAAAAAQWTQLQVSYINLRKEIENQVTVAEKLAAAKKIEGDARRAIVELGGDEAAIIQATADASRGEADALAVVSERRQEEVSILTRQREELTALAAQLGDPTGARQKEIDKINASIEARGAEAEKALQSAEASRLDAAAKQLAIRTHQDNAAALDTLRSAYDRAREALIATENAQRAGLATSEQVRAAQERLSVAEALYRDAVGDATAALERKVRAAQGSLSVTEAQIGLERERINTELASAQATGNSAEVLRNTIALKELDIKLIQAKIEALRIEAQALRAEASAALAALKANDPLLAQKRAEIELRLQNAKVKELEASRSTEIIRQINNEIETLRRRGVESNNGANQYVSDREREIDALDRVRAAAEGAAGAERSRYQENLLRQQGGPVDNSYIFQLRDRLRRGDSFSPDELPAIQNALRVAQDNANAQARSTVPSLVGSRDASQWVAVLTQVLERAKASSAAAQRTVNVNINGRNYGSVNTSSDADADTLTSIFTAIGESANRSGP